MTKSVISEEELTRLPIEYQFLTFLNLKESTFINLRNIEVNLPYKQKFSSINQFKPISKIINDTDE